MENRVCLRLLQLTQSGDALVPVMRTRFLPGSLLFNLALFSPYPIETDHKFVEHDSSYTMHLSAVMHQCF